MLRMLSLCTGIGGADLAAKWTNEIEVVGQVEINPFCRQVLAKIWPDVTRLSDIKKVVGDEFGAIDIVVGGIPCQPFSYAGERRGTDDDRHLWPYAFSIIKKAQPTWVIIENVAGFVDMALDLVASDLESENYTVQAYVFPACSIGAPHERQRCFVVGYSASCRLEKQQGTGGLYDQSHASSTSMADTSSNRCRVRTNQQIRQPECSDTAIIANDGPKGDVAHTRSSGWQEQHIATITGDTRHATRRTSAPGSVGQSQPRMGRGTDGFSARLDFARWPALPGCDQHEWEPPRTITTRIPNRNKRLEALGNAIVPQQIYPILQYIVEIERA